MSSHSRKRRGLLFLAAFVWAVAGAANVRAADTSLDAPATLAQAVKAIDLSALPPVSGAENLPHRRIAGLTYDAPGTVKNAYEFHRKQLLDRKWKELPGGYASAETCTATFARDGFLLSLMVYSAEKPGKAQVMLMNHGNVKLDKLPVPKGVRPFYGGPTNASYITDAPVDETAAACKKLLTAAGWQPYGTAIGSQYFKQNAVRLLVRVAAAPAQQGKTVIDYHTELMSADLPAPADTMNLEYADSTPRLFFETPAPQKEIADFYRAALAKAGWQATTTNFVVIDSKNELIFRNPAKEMLTLEMAEYTGKNRVTLQFQSAAEVAEIDKHVEETLARKKAEASKPLPKVALAIPAAAKDIEQNKSRIEFKLSSGKAKPIVESWRQRLAKDGWKEEFATTEDMAGSISLAKEGQHLTVIYSDTGLLPAEITIQATGVELERAAKAEKE